MTAVANPSHPQPQSSTAASGRHRVLVATTAVLAFISFWRAAAIVVNDMGSSAFYAGAIVVHFALQELGKELAATRPDAVGRLRQHLQNVEPQRGPA
jgi:hypothetical protein